MKNELRIDVYFDLVCPWCLIGKRHLGRALARLAESDPDVRVSVAWHSVQLVAGVPQGGWPFADFYERRLGSGRAVQARQAQVLAAAEAAGAAIDFSRIETFPDTARAHRLVALARQCLDAAGLDRLLDRLFAAYFQRGEDLGDVRVLAAIAAEHGLDPAALRSAPADGETCCESPPTGGVPCFVFGGRLALSGAQPAQVLYAAARQALGRAAPVAVDRETA